MNTLTVETEILKNLGLIAEDEILLKQVAKYLNRLVKRKKDETLLNKEDFFARIEEAERQYARGEYFEMNPGESLSDFLNRVG